MLLPFRRGTVPRRKGSYRTRQIPLNVVGRISDCIARLSEPGETSEYFQQIKGGPIRAGHYLVRARRGLVSPPRLVSGTGLARGRKGKPPPAIRA